jgi:hypothetical protein
MSDFTRGEFEARLEATEERMNARLAGIQAAVASQQRDAQQQLAQLRQPPPGEHAERGTGQYL